MPDLPDSDVRSIAHRTPTTVFGRWRQWGLYLMGLCALSGTLACATPNLPFPTLGGKQFWADEWVRADWRIQRNQITGHFRLLDAKDVRRAWGSLSNCHEVLGQHANNAPAESPHVVVLLHGILRSKDSLGAIADDLIGAGYRVIDINYPSTLRSIHEHSLQVGRVLRRLEGVTDVAFVTHSMGGLVTRDLLGSASRAGTHVETRDGCVPVRGVCMIFPPNQGAKLAEDWHRNPIYQLLFGPAGEEMRPAAVRQMPIPNVPVAVFAGGNGRRNGRNSSIPGDDDGTVGVSEAWIRGVTTFRVFPVGHTFGMNHPDLRAGVLEFLAGR